MISKRKLMILGIALSIIIIVVTGIAFAGKIFNKKDNANTGPSIPIVNFRTLEDGTKLNISPKLNMPKQFEGLDITSIQATCVHPQSTSEVKNSLIKGRTNLIATVTNNTEETLGGYFVNIIFVDEKGIPISDFKMFAEIIELAPGETTQLNSSITENLINAYDIKIEKAENE